AKHIHPNNKRRLIRAVEVYQATGKTLSERQAEQNKTSTYDYYIIGLKMDREALYDQINQRVDTMVQNGLVEEVKHLYERGYEHTQAMKAIGYQELIHYMKGDTDLKTAVELLNINTRRYAKRQYTWFTNQKNIHCYDVTNAKYVKIVDSILKDM